MKKIKTLFFILIFLQLTDGYKLVLLLFNQTTKVASILTLLLCLAYIFFNYKVFLQLYKNSLFKHWLRIILFLPIIFHCIHLVLDNITLAQFIYWIPLNAFYGSLFVVTAMLTQIKNSKRTINFMLISAIIFIIIGLVVSIFYYPFILRLEILTGDTRYDPDNFLGEVNRAVGFYGQPNLAAKALLSVFIILVSSYLPEKSNLTSIIIVLIVLLAIFWTGSRTALLIISLVLLINNPLIEKKIRDKKFKGIGLYRVLLTIRFVIPVIIILFFLLFILESIDGELSKSLIGRFSFFNSLFDDNTALRQDVSIRQRLDIIGLYIEYILNKPIFGHGISLREDLIANDVFDIGAQNEYLEFAFAFGVFYVLYYIYVLIRTFKLRINNSIENNLIELRALKITIVILFIYGFSLNYQYLDRVTVIILGLLLGILIKGRNSFLVAKNQNHD